MEIDKKLQKIKKFFGIKNETKLVIETYNNFP